MVALVSPRLVPGAGRLRVASSAGLTTGGKVGLDACSGGHRASSDLAPLGLQPIPPSHLPCPPTRGHGQWPLRPRLLSGGRRPRGTRPSPVVRGGLKAA